MLSWTLQSLLTNVHNVKQCSDQFYLRIIFALPSHNMWTFPIPFTSFFGNFWYTRRTGGGGKGCYHSTVDPRPATVNLPQLRELAPMEHGLDLRTRCFLAATASLLSSFTRDSDLEGEPLLPDTSLVVHKSHVFTLSASQNFMNFGFWSFGLFSFGFPLLLLNCWSWRMLWRCYCPRPDSLNSTFLGKNIKNLYYIIAYETEGFQIKVPMGKISLLYIQYHN